MPADRTHLEIRCSTATQRGSEIDEVSGNAVAIDNSDHPQDNFFTPINHEFYNSHPYSNLDPSKHEIRLLELLPVEPNEPLQARLLTSFFLSSDDFEAPSYCAISYFAGNHKETEVAYIDGVRFNVFANLARALRQVITARERGDLENYPQLIWADQICINQSNLSERSHQVGFMRKIYESAEVVLACLGWEDPSHGSWVEAMERLSIEANEDINVKDRIIYVKDRFFADFRDSEFQDYWRYLDYVLDSEWWRRGWIYQEVLVAKEVIVLFGLHSVKWDKLVPAVEAVYCILDRHLKQVRTGEVEMFEVAADRLIWIGFHSRFAKFVVDSRNVWEIEAQMAITTVLSHAQECKVTDIRDQVFAFVGLVDPGYRVIPDYTSSISTTFRLLCNRIILYECRLDILRWATRGASSPNDSKRRQDIPTWTPDWTDNAGISDFICPYPGDSPPFRASSDYGATAAFLPHAGIPDCILRVQCLFIDELCSTNSLFFSPRPQLIEDLQWWHQRAGVQQDAEDDEMYAHNPSIPIYSAFLNTAVRGMLSSWPGSGTEPEIQRHLIDSLEFGDFFRSPKDYFVLIKKGVQPRSSDRICILLGASVPFVLRKVDDHYILISDAYVEGLMYGETIKLMEQGELVVETIDIH